MAHIPRTTYLLLLALQAVWHGLLPEPVGNGQWMLAIVAMVPLLLPLTGILRLEGRSMTWGAYLVLLYFIVAVMEAWSNPPQRTVAATQVVLCCAYLASYISFSRRPLPPDRD